MKKFAIVLAACMLLTLCGCKGFTTIEGKGYATAEKAALAYAEALKTGDVNKVLSTFAIETYVENFDLEEYVECMRVYLLGSEIMFENLDEYTEGINLIGRQYSIARNLGYIYVNLSDYEEDESYVVLNGDPYDDSSDLMKDLANKDWMETLADMEIDDVEDMDFFVDNSRQDSLEERNERHTEYLGCDELQSLAVEIELDGDGYYLCVDVACYDGVWYNCNPGGTIVAALGATVYSGGLIPEDEV